MFHHNLGNGLGFMATDNASILWSNKFENAFVCSQCLNYFSTATLGLISSPVIDKSSKDFVTVLVQTPREQLN